MGEIEGRLTIEEIQEAVSYDPVTGLFTWKKARGRVKAGDRAGTITAGGYVSLFRKPQPLLAHRVAFLLMEKRWPKLMDHINGDRSDNRWINLRETDDAGNAQNLGVRSSNRHGTTGVSFNIRTGTWEASIRRHPRRFFLGYYATKEEASAAYAGAKRVLHETHPDVVQRRGR